MQVARDLGSAFVTIEPNTTAFATTLKAKLKAAMAAVGEQDIRVGADTVAVNRSLSALRVHLEEVTKRAFSIGIKLDDTQALADMALIDARLRAVAKQVVQPRLSLQGADRVLAELIAVDAALDRLAARSEETTAKLSTLSFTGFGMYRIWNGLTGRVQLFGGALSAVGIPKSIAMASGLHILGDALLEVGAVLIPATAAFLAFGAGAIGTVQDINRSMRALWNTTHALNQQIFPLSGGFQKLEEAVAPAVWNLFGQALEIVNANTAEFTKLARGAARVVENLGARITVALTSGGTSRLLANAAQDLAKIGDIIGNIFGSIAHILNTMPGYAEILLTVLDDVTGALDRLLGSPVGQWASGVFLAFHGFVLWAGLAATAAVAIGNALVGLAAKFGLAEAGALAFDALAFGAGLKVLFSSVAELGGALITMAGAEAVAAASTGVLAGAFAALDAVNPLVWIGLVGAALGFLAYNLFKGTDATNQYADAAQKAFEQLPVSSLGVSLTRQQAAAEKTLAIAQEEAALGFKEGYKNLALVLSGRKQLTHQNLQQLSTELSLFQTQADQKALLKTISGDYKNYSTVLKAAGGNTDLLNQAGITSQQILSANKDQLMQLVVEAKAAADAQNALALGTRRAAAAQNAQTNIFLQETVPAMKRVTDAEDALLQVITGGESAFIGFQQSIIGTTAKFKSPSGLADAAKLAGGNLSGLNAQSLAFANTLYNISIPGLQKMIDALGAQGASTRDVTTAVATGAKEMLQFTGNNVTARSVIASLINNALGPGTVTLQNMNRWVGANSTSVAGLNSIVARATVNASKFAGVLQGQLNAMLALAAANALGGQRALDQFALGIERGDNASKLLVNDGGAKVLAMFRRMYQGDAPKAQKAFVDWAENGLGLSRQAAIDLWKTLNSQLNPQIQHTAQVTVPQAKKSFIDWAQNGLSITHKQAGALWGALTKQLGPQLQKMSSKTVPEVHRVFVNWAEHSLHLTQKQAEKLYQQTFPALQKEINSLHGKAVTVTVNVGAAGTITAKAAGVLSQAAGLTGSAVNQIADRLRFGAAGGQVAGGRPGKDSVMAMLTPGEVVVPTSMVKAGAVDHLRGHLPGFAAGGIAGLGRSIASGQRYAGASEAIWGRGTSAAYARAMKAAWLREVKKSLTAMQAANRGMPAPLGGASAFGGSGAAMAYARGLLPVYGWASQWPALNALWARESGWNPYAVNPSSGAYGIPQALGKGHPYNLGDYATQIRWGLAYIAGRYGNPNSAWAHEVAFNWYGKGGQVADRGALLRPGANLLVNKTGRNEHLVPPGGTMEIHLHNHGVIGSQHQVETWLEESIDRLARRGRLTYAIRHSPSAAR